LRFAFVKGNLTASSPGNMVMNTDNQQVYLSLRPRRTGEQNDPSYRNSFKNLPRVRTDLPLYPIFFESCLLDTVRARYPLRHPFIMPCYAPSTPNCFLLTVTFTIIITFHSIGISLNSTPGLYSTCLHQHLTTPPPRSLVLPSARARADYTYGIRMMISRSKCN